VRRSSAILALLLFGLACERPSRGDRARPTETRSASRETAPPALTYVERVTAGAAAHARLPTIVAIHGLGDQPENFVTLFEAFPIPVRIVAPRAPTPWGDGFAWMTSRVRDGDEVTLAREIDASTARLVALLEVIVAREDVAGPVLLTGFSQGGILTYAITLARPDLVRAAFPIGGLLPSGRLTTLPSAQTGSPRIIAFHGDRDTIVPYARDVALVEALRTRGFDVTLETSEGVGHVIPERMQAGLYDALARALTPSR
jgi:phospholipase/carboxylesterase